MKRCDGVHLVRDGMTVTLGLFVLIVVRNGPILVPS